MNESYTKILILGQKIMHYKFNDNYTDKNIKIAASLAWYINFCSKV